ncbi:hypothetical protein ACFX1W_003757 [Malus domestica]
MERYYKKQCLNPPSNISGSPSPSNIPSSHPPPPSNIRSPPLNILSSSQQSEPTELDEILANLHADPGYRRRMLDYPPNYREAIRRHYLQNDPCQPRDHIMPRKVSNKRCFITGWFDRFKWLEYSISKDAAFCRYCYLFKCDFDQMGSTGNDVFTEKGFTNWRKGPENLRAHEGGVGSLHNKAVQQARDLMTQKQHIETFVIKQTDEARNNYHTLLRASLECTRWLLGQGLPFRGHDESLKSSNRGNYLELMHFLSKHNEQVKKVVFENAPKNLKYTSSDIQKDLVRACAIETINAITKDMEEHDIVVSNMEDLHFVPGKSRRKAPRLTNFHYYRVDLYFQVLDTQLKELNDRFNEVNTELLLCMACLGPMNNFASFDKAKIVRLAQLYPQDFDRMDLMNLPIQLDNYIHDMKMHSEFSSLRGIGDLAKELVKTGKCASYILVYKLLTLTLVLPVATASVERAFSAMKIVKTPLRNKMGDQWLSDSMLVYIERYVFAFIDNEPIMRHFHGMKRRRQQL